MAFASGQRVTAAMLNRITRNDLEAVVTSDQNATTSDVDLGGATMSVTTIQANTVLQITASLDCGSTGISDLPFVKLVVGGSTQADNFKLQMAGRGALSKTWLVTVAAASTFTVKLVLVKIGTSNVATVYGTHSTLVVSGNGIS